MKKLTIGVFAGFLLMSSQCSMDFPNEADLPSWSVNISVPIAVETLTIDDLLKDSLFVGIPYGVSGDSILAYEKSINIESVKVGNQLEIDNIHKSFIQNIDEVKVDGTEKSFSSSLESVGIDPISKSISSQIGKIELNDTEKKQTEPIFFTNIIDLTSVPEGVTKTISQGTQFPVIYRTVKFDNFDSAIFTFGELGISINNNLVVELGHPITVRLLDADSSTIVGSDGDTAKAEWTVGISTRNTGTKQISLAGKTLPGEVIVQISGAICGSGPMDITNNETARNSSFIVEVQARNLAVSQAVAIIPEQQIDTTNTITLSPDQPNKVSRAQILDGKMTLNVQNNLPVDIQLQLIVQSIDITSSQSIEPLTRSFSIPANQLSDISVALDSYFLVMDIADQKVEYSYQILTEDTNPEKATLSETDNILVDLSIAGKIDDQITFSMIEGIIEQQTIVENGEITVESGSRITSAVISSGSLTFNFDNRINQTASGVPQIVVNLPQIVNSTGTPLSVTLNLNPGVLTSSQDLTNYRLEPLLQVISSDSTRQYLTYETTITTSIGEIARYNLMDSIIVQINVSEMHFSSVTGYFNQEAIVSQDTIHLEQPTKIQTAEIAGGDMILTMTNQIGVIANVEFTIDEIIHKITNQPLKKNIELSADPSPSIVTIPLDGYRISLPLANLSDNQQIHYKSTIEIPSDAPMTLSLEEEIEVQVDLNDLSFSSIAGIIDPVSIDLDTVEQEISALPDELNGVDLSNVDISIIFDTNIGVPVRLNLTLMSYNESGDTVYSVIDQIITENPIVQILNAEDLINIKPKKIVAYGNATVGGTGTVDTSQYVSGVMQISVPMEMIIKEDAVVELDPELVDENIPKEIESATIIAKIDNGFDFGGKIELLAAKDTMYFSEGFLLAPDTLAVLNIYPDSSFTEKVVLDDTKFALFEDSLYIKPNIKLFGMKDISGNPIPSRILTKDTMKLQISGIIRGLVDLPELANKGK